MVTLLRIGEWNYFPETQTGSFVHTPSVPIGSTSDAPSREALKD